MKERYGENSSVPYKIMNARGFMHGSKETAKGRAAEKKHMRKIGANRELADVRGGRKSNPNRYQPSGLIRGLGGERKRAADKTKKKHKGSSFTEALK